jgi:peptidoglycan hydrolase-like protein with peptidoglycan-binding domain
VGSSSGFDPLPTLRQFNPTLFCRFTRRPDLDKIAGIQKRLQNLGFSIGESADGVFGTKTRSGVSAFQRKYKLPVTGKPDSTTQAKLKEMYGC